MRHNLTKLRSIAHGLAAAVALTGSLALPAAAHAQTQTQTQTQAPSGAESEFLSNTKSAIWIAAVEETERGHLVGNPEAGSQLIEFLSYTCGHCASFVRESGPTLDLVAVAPGHLSIEIRSVIRNGVDLAITQLARCGGPEKFKDLHRMFLYTQSTWLKKAASAPPAQQAIWQRGDAAGRLNAARALDLDDMVANRGLAITQINTCLADDVSAQAILAADKADRAEFNVQGTPTFALNGQTLEQVHSWGQLSQVLQTNLQPPAPSGE